MILRYSLRYLVARGVPALVNFLAVAVYTRLLTPEAYGYYVLVIAGVNVLNLVCFQWLRFALVRYLPAHQGQEEGLLGTIGWSYLALMFLVGSLGGAAAGLVADARWRSLMGVGVLLLWAQAWFELNAELLRARLQTQAYGWAMGARSVGALGLGTLFILSGLEAYGPLWGLVVSMVGIGIVFAYQHWRVIPIRLDTRRLRLLLRYGLPVAGSLAFNLIIVASDRFLIAWLLDEAHAGIYAAGYDLAYQPVILLMHIVYLAVYPLIVKAWEQEGKPVAYTYLSRNAQLLLIIAVPATVGLVLLRDAIASLVLGEAFQAASAIIAWVAVGTLLDGMRVYHADLAFHLGQRTMGQLRSVLWGALVNIGLNLLWIPRVGIIGAAWATVVSCGIALLLSIWWGRTVLPIPWGLKKGLGISMAGIGMGITIGVLKASMGWIGAGIVGIGMYGVLLAILLKEDFTRICRNIRLRI
ncbi:oligosaccharide flippase family protein [Rhodothermus profundi]|uniref:Membrane protein involved in the export of O-antigen and teichoic acid n=1 Tax=Rhodothermus profundi TaxID=633813 RepID=A0A1M6VFN3_9BACT|nr:oligosaccharide flippase family protein [Rhodothermus profundi]SHK80259.1 Membrane protein involved in the export of O-antigen and teichoic acid [Rhodothermus profundi]